MMKSIYNHFYKFIVSYIYADHNQSFKVKNTLNKLINKNIKGKVINIGSGNKRLHDDIINLDIFPGENIDVVLKGETLPFTDKYADLVISQECLEHVENYEILIKDIYRILKNGGIFYLQTPWIIGYHGCPKDYWRFSRDGLISLSQKLKFSILEIRSTVGPFTGLYRILVESFAIFCSNFSQYLYKPGKLISSIVFYPLKLLDPFFEENPNSHKIAGGFFLVLKKN